MEASCRLPLADLCLPSAGRFNASWQETWGFAFRFLSGNHKAVKRRERLRSEYASGIPKLVIAQFLQYVVDLPVGRPGIAANPAKSTNHLPVAKRYRRQVICQ
jgi:hypothetical protein